LKSKSQILILTILITAVSACGKDRAPADDSHKDTIGIIETRVTNWFYTQQLNNGLLESVENSTGASLYDNALGAMVFMLQNDYQKAEKIFDFFNARIDSELNAGIGGFSLCE